MRRPIIAGCVCAPALLILCSAVWAEPPSPPPPPPPVPRPAGIRGEPKPADASQSTRVRLDIFTVQLSPEQGVDFSLDAVRPGASSTKELLFELGKQGKAALSYRFDERIDLTQQTRLTTGERVPITQSVSVGSGGKTSPSVSYEKVGCIVDLKGRWEASPGAKPIAQVSLRLNISDVSSSSITVADELRLPMFSELSIDRDLWARSGEPLLTAVVRARKSPKNEVEGYSACVVRLQLDRLEAKD